MAIDNDQLLKVIAALDEAGGNKQKAADALGMHVNTLKYQIQLATRRNLYSDAFGGVVPPGYELGKITQLHKSDDGKTMEWRHLQPLGIGPDPLDEIERRFSQSITPLAEVPTPLDTEAALATLYPIPDVHMGQYSWGKETGGESYDLDIAKTVVTGAFDKLVGQTPASKVGIVLILGDFYHADGFESSTPKSGNSLDTDSRYNKVQWMGTELAIALVDRALQKHETIIVRALPGNHDPRGGETLVLALWNRYHGNPRVIVDRTPGQFWFFQHGDVMLAGHHGHTVKPEQMPGVMAAYEPAMWGSTKFRHAYLGHFHRRVRGVMADERSGAVWEVLQAITAKDAWNRGQGHASGRSVSAMTFHRKEGLVLTNTVPIIRGDV
jgi:hypothetical protein